jgi:transglutaminase-like putative cysteine protease
MSTADTSVRLDRKKLLWLMLPLAIPILMHYEHLPVWTLIAAVALILWRSYILIRGNALPSPWILRVLVVAGIVAMVLSYRSVPVRTAWVSLLVVLALLKLLEMRTQRDAMISIFVGYMLVITNFLYSQAIPVAALMALGVWLMTAALIGANCEKSAISTKAKLRLSGTMLLQAIPLMLLLFLLFPRVQGPLWRTPPDAQSGRSGLSEKMEPGSINRLSLSDDIAFRAKFEGLTPKAAQLYWRGPVLWDFDGRTWSVGNSRPRPLEFEALNVVTDYTVTLEPSDKPWLFALELAAEVPPNAKLTFDYQLLANEPVRNRTSYHMRSYLSFHAKPLESRSDLAPALQMPYNFNPKTVALARGWRAQYGDGDDASEAIVNRALNMFRQEQFSYTLTPPLLGRNSVDEFLFETRQGFCEHYSGSFVFLMRAARVPARVVTGYLGGDVNPVNFYMEVRQSDAHAWAEVWLPNKGWIRVDPTAAVAPGRIEAGLAGSVSAGDALPFFARTDLAWVRNLRYNWDALANAWNQAVLGFNPERQREVLLKFGLEPDWLNMGIALSLSCGILMLGFMAYLTRRYQAGDPVLRAYLAFCAKLAKHGVARRADEGPLDFARRAAAAWPERAGDIKTISEQYIDLRYGHSAREQAGKRHATASRSLLQDFKSHVADFSL